MTRLRPNSLDATPSSKQNGLRWHFSVEHGLRCLFHDIHCGIFLLYLYRRKELYEM